MSTPMLLSMTSIDSAMTPQQISSLVNVFLSTGYIIRETFVRTGDSFRDVFRSEDLSTIMSVASQHRNLRMIVAHTVTQLEIRVVVNWEPDTEMRGNYTSLYLISTQELLFIEGSFTAPEYSPVYYGRKLLDLGKEIYGVMKPQFGFSDYGDLEIAPNYDQLLNEDVFGSVETVYWANFFSPSLVKRIGRERLELPLIGWSEPLTNGGILYVVAPTFFDDNAEAPKRRLMKEYLGL